jgi:nucleolar MIF4G domain-containing protein 1
MFGSPIVADLLRDSGQQLRQDDPSALKDIVQIVQSKASGAEKTPKYGIV